jgi:hypothetical protein
VLAKFTIRKFISQVEVRVTVTSILQTGPLTPIFHIFFNQPVELEVVVAETMAAQFTPHQIPRLRVQLKVVQTQAVEGKHTANQVALE